MCACPVAFAVSLLALTIVKGTLEWEQSWSPYWRVILNWSTQNWPLQWALWNEEFRRVQLMKTLFPWYFLCRFNCALQQVKRCTSCCLCSLLFIPKIPVILDFILTPTGLRMFKVKLFVFLSGLFFCLFFYYYYSYDTYNGHYRIWRFVLVHGRWLHVIFDLWCKLFVWTFIFPFMFIVFMLVDCTSGFLKSCTGGPMRCRV